MKITGVQGYTIPMFGNKRALPYGDLIVTDDEGKNEKLVPIKDEEGTGRQYVTFMRKRYYVENAGSLYSPRFVIV